MSRVKFACSFEEKEMLKVAIVGATGYTGEELVRILVNHPKVEITSLTAKIEEPIDIADIFPNLSGKISMVCDNLVVDEVTAKCDLAYLALPHRVSMEVAPKFLKADVKVIDLSADYRLKDVGTYEKWYGSRHRSPELVAKAIYGLPELYRDQIRRADLVANPGCYPTGIILACAPLVKEGLIDLARIIVDSYSGLTGAGRRASMELQFSEVSENLRAYKVDQHQHAPEIDQELTKLAGCQLKIIFVPHLAPISRGILSTIYLRKKKEVSLDRVIKLFSDFYRDEPFVRVKAGGSFPQVSDVVGTNYCDIGCWTKEGSPTIIVISAIDNLTKGAAGQAVQNMNIMCGFEETLGLK